MINIEKFFKPEQNIFLEKIDYTIGPISNKAINNKLICVDEISTQGLEDNKIKLSFSRKINIEDDVLCLFVKFGTILTLNDSVKIDCSADNFAQEFVGTHVLTTMISRVALLIAQITSSYGQTPIITPPAIIKEN